jgi:hypothetical protein
MGDGEGDGAALRLLGFKPGNPEEEVTICGFFPQGFGGILMYSENVTSSRRFRKGL